MSEGQAVGWLEQNWQVMAGFAAGLVAWGRTMTTLSYTSKELDEAKQRVQAVETDITEIKASVARIEAHQERTQHSLDTLVRQLQG